MWNRLLYKAALYDDNIISARNSSAAEAEAAASSSAFFQPGLLFWSIFFSDFLALKRLQTAYRLLSFILLVYLPSILSIFYWHFHDNNSRIGTEKKPCCMCAFIYHYMLCYNEKPSSSPSSDSLRLFWSFFFLATQSVRFLPQG